MLLEILNGFIWIQAELTLITKRNFLIFQNVTLNSSGEIVGSVISYNKRKINLQVFNHSVNYECFEPLQITKNCALHLKILVSKYNITSIALSKPVKDWLQKRLSIENSIEFDSFSELIAKYKSVIPETEKQLSRILEPTYSAKLIREIAYLQIKNTVISGSPN